MCLCEKIHNICIQVHVNDVDKLAWSSSVKKLMVKLWGKKLIQLTLIQMFRLFYPETPGYVA